MTTTTKIKSIAIKTLLLLLVLNLTFSCSDNKNNAPKEDTSTQIAAKKAKSEDTIIVNGNVKAVTFGKDGYTAEVQTDTQGVYAALVSIVNVGGRENYKPCDMGDKVSFKGVPSVLGDVKQLQVKEIISITSIINGTVKAVKNGKDGYTADVQTTAGGVYAALVSISNLGGPDHYQQCAVGDKVSFKGVPSVLGGVKQLRVEEIIHISGARNTILISPISFRGIQIGDLIANHSDYIKKTQLKTGEGTFEVYEIKDFENNPAGYFVPDPNDKLLVGDITVNSPKAETAKGIKIGNTFKDLLKAFPNIAVHGSEIESRTTATANNISYRLDIANNKYDIDKSKIPATTKITEITINRGETAKALISAAKYGKIQPNEYCWQTNKALQLHAQPASNSKVEGKHFAGETLKVLGTKIVNNQLWVNVTYTLSVKAGYEDQFADGRVTPNGSPTGWIGGAETPTINCK
jgi:hypothetical protein